MGKSSTKPITRCQWSVSGNDAYLEYHDTEWGVPIHDDRTHFEFLILESAQAGLSWATVLNKRAGYRKAFVDFDPVKVARFTEKKIEKLLTNRAIIRNRLKINAAVNNARQFLVIQDEFGSFDRYAWSFVDGQTIKNRWKTMSDIPASSAQSDAMSQDMKRRGFKFFGTTICYAHMQAVGMVNDHTTDCFRYRQV